MSPGAAARMITLQDMGTPTIYEWAGGRAGFERWLNQFYDLVEGDDLLAPLFEGKVTEEHRRHVTTWWSEVMGGPADYTAELEKLAKLRDEGVITPDDFEAKKKQLLGI